MKVHGLIVAAGRGTRLKGPLPKQYRPLSGVSILERTLQVFAQCRTVDGIVLVVPGPDIDRCRRDLAAAGSLQAKPTAIVAGGPERQDSVRAGLAAVPDADSLVAIHDAVRPLITAEELGATIAAGRRYGAAILGLPVWDTLKLVQADGVVLRTVPREGMWLAQTPQVFRAALIREAHARAHAEGYRGTDDAELLERLGKKVHVVPGSRTNLKITTAEDLAVAEALIEGRCRRPRRPGR
jgi:2-C-methyl-D-erythritol 4-phosphate cytidylyltransferase